MLSSIKEYYLSVRFYCKNPNEVIKDFPMAKIVNKNKK
jgi:hypothetical protein